MGKAITIFFTVMLTISMTIAIVLTSVQLVAFNEGFYMKEFEKYDRAEATGMSYGQLREVARAFIAYLSGQSSELNMEVMVNGQQRMLFNEKELSHMDDVLGLFEGGFKVRLWSIILIAVSIIAIAVWGYKKGFAGILRALIWASGVPLALGGVIALLLATNFDRWFIYFHLAFFDNDLWQLDPSSDMLINIFNEGFFADAAFQILIYAALFLVLILIVSIIGIIYANKHVKLHEKNMIS